MSSIVLPSILLRLSIDQSSVAYVLTCEGGNNQQECLIKWLTSKNIALCKPEQYDNPDTLKPLNVYCVGIENEIFKLFQVLVTADWDDKENPPPQFVNDISLLAWVIVPSPLAILSKPLI